MTACTMAFELAKGPSYFQRTFRKGVVGVYHLRRGGSGRAALVPVVWDSGCTLGPLQGACGATVVLLVLRWELVFRFLSDQCTGRFSLCTGKVYAAPGARAFQVNKDNGTKSHEDKRPEVPTGEKEVPWYSFRVHSATNLEESSAVELWSSIKEEPGLSTKAKNFSALFPLHFGVK